MLKLHRKEETLQHGLPSSGGIGIRLKTPNTMFRRTAVNSNLTAKPIKSPGLEGWAELVMIRYLKIIIASVAEMKLLIGPASWVMTFAIVLRRQFSGLTGTGFAQPNINPPNINPTSGNKIVPI